MVTNEEKRSVVIGSDHAGYKLKLEIIKYLEENNIKYSDAGGDEAPCDYPEIAVKVCGNVMAVEGSLGILVCGTGIGMSIAANKITGIRAAVCTDEFSAKYARMHNDANVLCLGSRVSGTGIALEIADIFINTSFEGGRHQRRIDIIKNIESGI